MAGRDRRKVVWKRLFLYFSLGVIVGLGVWLIFLRKNENDKTRIEETEVDRVIDGDTVEVIRDRKKEMVRLIGIDAPEIANSVESGECFGREAREEVKRLLTGEKIKLLNDKTQADRDIYGRLLRYVFLTDGTNINLLLIERGFAREYDFEGRYYLYRQEFTKAQDTARQGGWGLWGSCR